MVRAGLVIRPGTPSKSASSTPYRSAAPEKWTMRIGREGTWGVRALRDGDPDLRRKLGADVVYVQRREQTDDGAVHAGGHGAMRVVLGDLGVGAAVEAAAEALDGAFVHEPPQRPGVDAPVGGVAGAEEDQGAEVPQAGGGGPRGRH